MKNLRLVEINTTAYSEENLAIITDLTDEQIKEVVEPIVMAERDGESDEEYDNTDLLLALINEYHATNFIQIVFEPEVVVI